MFSLSLFGTIPDWIVVTLLVLGSSSYVVTRFSCFEYSDITTEYTTFLASIGIALTYWLVLLGMLITGNVYILMPLVQVAITIGASSQLQTADLLFLHKYERVANCFLTDPSKCSRDPLIITVLLILMTRSYAKESHFTRFQHLHNIKLEEKQEQICLINGIERKALASSGVLQFLVEWLLQAGLAVNAFFIFYKLFDNECQPAYSVIQLELNRFLSMKVPDASFCGKISSCSISFSEYVLQLFEE